METRMADRLDAICGIKSRNGKTYWTKVGVAFPSRQGNGRSEEHTSELQSQR